MIKPITHVEFVAYFLPFGAGNECSVAQSGSLKTEVRTEPRRKEQVRQKAELTRRGSPMWKCRSSTLFPGNRVS